MRLLVHFKSFEQEYKKLAETIESIDIGFVRSRSILASLHIVKRISLAGISSLLKQINLQVDNMVFKEVAVYCCFLLNPANKCYLMWLPPKHHEEKWLDAKWEMMKKFIKTQFKENPKDRNHLQFLSRCAQQLGDFRLSKFFEKKVARFQPNTSQTCREAVKTHEVSPLQVVEADGSIYDRAPPGDTDKESYRLSTYIKFPPESPVNPRDLASAGFFFTRYKDRVKCFSCGLCVGNWVLGDDVKAARWHRHDCQMMLGRECGNVPIAGAANVVSVDEQPCSSTALQPYVRYSPVAPNFTSTVSQQNNTTLSAGALTRATSVRATNDVPVDEQPCCSTALQPCVRYPPRENGFHHCGTGKCTTCKYSQPQSNFISANTQEQFSISQYIDCKSSNVIYLITCSKCNEQYVGKTQRIFKTRITEHIRSIRDKTDNAVGRHFNLPDHNMDNFTITAIEKHAESTQLQKRELWWIKKLNTLEKNGLNMKK